jgi:FkbM family methyltransferase
MNYYSASNTCQDRWVVEAVFRGRRNGYFVDIGATNGIGANNTYALESQLGWTGICIEPNSDRFAELRKNRRCVCEDLCVYSRATTVKFTEPGAFPGYGGITEHLVPHKKAYWSVDAREVDKQTATLQDLLTRHGAPKRIEYLSLDVEGSEYEILKGFPFDEYTFLAISVEGRSCDDLLENQGYERVDSPYCEVIWEHFFLYRRAFEDASTNPDVTGG